MLTEKLFACPVFGLIWWDFDRHIQRADPLQTVGFERCPEPAASSRRGNARIYTPFAILSDHTNVIVKIEGSSMLPVLAILLNHSKELRHSSLGTTSHLFCTSLKLHHYQRWKVCQVTWRKFSGRSQKTSLAWSVKSFHTSQLFISLKLLLFKILLFMWLTTKKWATCPGSNACHFHSCHNFIERLKHATTSIRTWKPTLKRKRGAYRLIAPSRWNKSKIYTPSICRPPSNRTLVSKIPPPWFLSSQLNVAIRVIEEFEVDFKGHGSIESLSHYRWYRHPTAVGFDYDCEENYLLVSDLTAFPMGMHVWSILRTITQYK